MVSLDALLRRLGVCGPQERNPERPPQFTDCDSLLQPTRHCVIGPRPASQIWPVHLRLGILAFTLSSPCSTLPWPWRGWLLHTLFGSQSGLPRVSIQRHPLPDTLCVISWVSSFTAIITIKNFLVHLFIYLFIIFKASSRRQEPVVCWVHMCLQSLEQCLARDKHQTFGKGRHNQMNE